ncbi:RIB43A-like with coiled-coils protein 2 isoform X1 [Sabethes cyaneus]|uniref:RIB43A-like with coiled-coils protein 2 isoform X1 n=1 Tax=Sabethes cyaneus TaxID=53552 RepID=UPI00237E7CC4|nr:RIB43A-like with coiled-coils protein 2 isoform X1 [Sabethes cyaneus]
MLNSTFINHQDRKETAAIERRRQYEEARRLRIFNARQRVFGIDRFALENQLKEKHQKQQDAIEQQRKVEDEQQRQNQVIQLKNREQLLLRQQLDTEINQFRALHQRPEQSRDFDLFDPNFLKKSLPARINDDDPRLTVSGAQKFEGEDLFQRDRTRFQKQQQRSWLEQQIRDKRQAEMDRIASERFLDEALQAREKKVCQLAAEERTTRHKIQQAVNQYNQHLLEQQDFERSQQKHEEQEDNLAEIYNHLTSDILTENPEVAKSSLGPNRIIPYAYKGMSLLELQQIRETQEKQREDLNRRQKEEANNKESWDQLTIDFDQRVVLKDREINRRRRLLAGEIGHENLKLCNEQQQTLKYLNQTVYQNRPTMEYFNQFNTTSR